MPAGVLGNEKRLRQLLLNLLGNAIKFTEKGQVVFQKIIIKNDKLAGNYPLEQSNTNSKLRTEISYQLRFLCEDTGPGMTPEHLEKIFQPFEPVGDVKKRSDGTGLRLAIARQIVTEKHGGKLFCKSIPGEGTEFTIELFL